MKAIPYIKDDVDPTLRTSRVVRHTLLTSSILPLLLVTGCVHALRPDNKPSQQKLHIQTASPANCVVRVADEKDFPVAADGRVTFAVPSLPRGCDTLVFGVVKIKDGSPENITAIHLLKDGKVVRKLSLTTLGKLPVDAEGFHILILK